jgi:SAM-dependent methyltransferase
MSGIMEASLHQSGNLVGLSLVAPDRVGAVISSKSDFHPVHRVRIFCDGAEWATVPVVPCDGGVSFSCQLRPVAEERLIVVEARNADTNQHLGTTTQRISPVYNAYGLSAHSVLESVHGPLCSMLGLGFDGANLVVSGYQLPPNGDPSQLQVEFGAGVCYSVEYGLYSPNYESHYWYWPNSYLSALRISIDLVASSPGSNPFEFRLIYPQAETLGGGARRRQSEGAVIHNVRNVYIPNQLQSFIGFPTDVTQLTRVQAHDDAKSVTFTGYTAFKNLEAIMARYGKHPNADIAVLDWGCGHGRITRHFIQNWRNARIYGIDIDAENVAWCKDNLIGGQFLVGPLWPPVDLPESSFDVIFGVSVMTHLTVDAQSAWLRELSRLLKPDGLALLTFAGPGAVGFSSIWRSRSWWDAWLQSGFDDKQYDTALEGKISDETYYRNSYQTSAHVRQTYSRYLTVEAIELEIFGYQDLVVLRRPSR